MRSFELKVSVSTEFKWTYIVVNYCNSTVPTQIKSGYWNDFNWLFCWSHPFFRCDNSFNNPWHATAIQRTFKDKSKKLTTADIFVDDIAKIELSTNEEFFDSIGLVKCYPKVHQHFQWFLTQNPPKAGLNLALYTTPRTILANQVPRKSV